MTLISTILGTNDGQSTPIYYNDGNPNGDVTSKPRLKVVYDYTNDLIYTCSEANIGTNNNWAEVSAAQSFQYSLSSGVTNVEVWATGTGVTITENASGGELTIAIPTAVDLIDIQIKITSAALDVNNSYYILLDYAGDRGFNSSIDDLLLPNVSVGSGVTTSMSRSAPLLYSTDGYANVDVGVSAFGGGDGSDLEIAIKDFLIASTQQVHLKF
jgi:hypothetical protein